MINPDVFVGSVAIGLGLLVCSAAVFNWEWYYRLHKARWIESICGRGGARVFFVILGIGLIVLGVSIATGILSDGTLSQSEDRNGLAPVFFPKTICGLPNDKGESWQVLSCHA